MKISKLHYPFNAQEDTGYNELQWNWNTQKAQNRPSVVVPWYSKCIFLSQLRVLELIGIRSLLTPGLCQPRSSPEP